MLKVLQGLENSSAGYLLDTEVRISCEPSDSPPEELKRYQGSPDTFTPLFDGGSAIGLVMCYVGFPNNPDHEAPQTAPKT